MIASTVIEETWAGDRQNTLAVYKPEKPADPNAQHLLILWQRTAPVVMCISGAAAYRALVQCMKAACSAVAPSDAPKRKVRGVAVATNEDSLSFTMDAVVVDVRELNSSSASASHRFVISVPQPWTDPTPGHGEPDRFELTITIEDASSLGAQFVKLGKNRRKAVLSSTTEEWFCPPLFTHCIRTRSAISEEDCRRAYVHVNKYGPQVGEFFTSCVLRRMERLVSAGNDVHAPANADSDALSADPGQALRLRPWLSSPPLRGWDDYECEVEGFRAFGKDFSKAWLATHPGADKAELIQALIETHRFIPVELATSTARYIADRAYASSGGEPAGLAGSPL